MSVFTLLALLTACGGGGDAPPNPAPTAVWTWLSGSQTTYQAGIYGTKGGTSPLYVPGARSRAVSRVDSSGKFWLFGGDGRDSAGLMGLLNDLWKYDPSAQAWTWVSGSDIADQTGVYGTKGTPAPLNVPGGRFSAVSWLDSQGNLWLFGGEGYDSAGNIGKLNDLWKFDMSTLEWIWASGSNASDQLGIYGTKGTAAPSNVPGARSGAVSWRDSSGQLWLFGGSGYDSAGTSSVLNDVWKFNPISLEWTWVSGSDTADQLGAYGIKGQADLSNVPGARVEPLSWLDSKGRLWLFGGVGWSYDWASNVCPLNDLWEFDPATLEWTWVSGSNTVDQAGVYGTLDTPDPSNTPGARSLAAAWLDPNGNLWLFGGSGDDSAGGSGFLNDLWKYDSVTSQWTWVSGSSTVDQVGKYGTLGTAASSNVPGARGGAVSWIGSDGKIWLFGGFGYASGVTYSGLLNDLWRYTQ